MQFQSVYATTAIDGWNLGNPVQNGATTTYEVTKEAAGKVFKGTVSVSPSTAQVAKNLIRGGLVGLALNAVTQALLDGVDFVMDPANNSIRYKPKVSSDSNSSSGSGNYFVYLPVQSFETKKKYFATAIDAAKYACSQYQSFYGWIVISSSPDILDKRDGSTMYSICTYKRSENSEPETTKLGFTYYYDTNPQIEVPISTVATQIIDLANQGNSAAQDYIAAVNQDLVDNDEEQIGALVANLKQQQETSEDAASKCPSGIVNNGSCWICDKSSHYEITRATRDAKTATRGKSCKNITDNNIKSANANLFRNLISARERENACWSPPDANHILRLSEDKIALSNCEK
ncbi:hypothetical protein [Acinetobacter rathckeae]|uniref:hypothetical protein n=1 Tax=Acinetobacter rathckeae TaxID=2605272 RepID=UPI0018A2B39B|nr:hypothetical protein [Acinetobacter rathckeae]MBF7696616.1 hypothetical protein [Acinetobacter rathckeae]